MFWKLLLVISVFIGTQASAMSGEGRYQVSAMGGNQKLFVMIDTKTGETRICKAAEKDSRGFFSTTKNTQCGPWLSIDDGSPLEEKD